MSAANVRLRLQFELELAAPAQLTALDHAQLCRALAVHDVRADLPYITTPLLLLAGERDTSTPIANVELVAETAPRASLHVVAGAAHQVPVARPVETANLIRSFITGNVASLVVSESSD